MDKDFDELLCALKDAGFYSEYHDTFVWSPNMSDWIHQYLENKGAVQSVTYIMTVIETDMCICDTLSISWIDETGELHLGTIALYDWN